MRIHNSEELPKFLQSYNNLRDHFEEHFEKSTSNERGDRFVDFVQKLIPFTEVGKDFPDIKISSKKSHDKGIDLFSASNENGENLFVQSKYKIRSKDDIDSVFSKFQAVMRDVQKDKKLDLFSSMDDRTQYMLVTSSLAESAFDNYEKSGLSSVDFYKNLKRQGRVHIIKGDILLDILKTLYRKSHLVPQKFELSSCAGWIVSESVHIGIVRANDIAALYQEHGDALFFENIREFLGLDKHKKVKDREYVNHEIVATLTDMPTRMLAKNNGITIRASSVEAVDSTKISVSSGAIVNGCQTTNCIYRAPRNEKAEILVKVVASEDGWDVAQSANYQNPVARIDLEIAKFVRPALVQKYAASIGYDVKTESESSVTGVVSRIYKNSLNYEAIRTIFLGVFSKKPNNMFQNNYTEISGELVSRVFEQVDIENDVFRVLFIAVIAGDEALKLCEKAVGDSPDLPSRLFDETKYTYRMLLLLLALSAAADEDISAKDEGVNSRADNIIRFLSTTKNILEANKDLFYDMYRRAFMSISEMFLDSDGIDKAQKDFYNKVSRLDFSSALKKILLRVRLDKSI
ncbi:AIPR family protein [Azospirillum doebereinerae]